VYENLMDGSENHLRAFVSTLGRYGESYEPRYLDQATIDEIVAAGPAGGPGGNSRLELAFGMGNRNGLER
jgi:hypothetical protein